jgi:murein L,D-transpeptidase YafK
MRSKIIILLCLSILLACTSFVEQEKDEPSFKEKQLAFPRVREAIKFNEVFLQTKLLLKNINKSDLQLYLRAFKMEETIEVWAKNKSDKTFQLIANYKFCNSSGTLGPKRQQGDNQIPEGIYNIAQFNPTSNYHLSLKVSYPNMSDSILGVKSNYGGDIYLHGGCATVGCIPITDYWISELYVLCVLAKDAGQENIPIHIFPARLNRANSISLQGGDYPELDKALWRDLEKGYNFFEQRGEKPSFLINENGQYVLASH